MSKYRQTYFRSGAMDGGPCLLSTNSINQCQTSLDAASFISDYMEWIRLLGLFGYSLSPEEVCVIRCLSVEHPWNNDAGELMLRSQHHLITVYSLQPFRPLNRWAHYFLCNHRWYSDWFLRDLLWTVAWVQISVNGIEFRPTQVTA